MISGEDYHEGGGQFVYIDDVSVIQFGGCDHVCSLSGMSHRITSPLGTEEDGFYNPGNLYNSDDETTLGDENELRTYVLTGTTSDVATDQETESDYVVTVCVPNTTNRLHYLIENAVRIQFMVLHPSGNGSQLLYYQEVYDYNGLHDEYNGTVYPDYQFEYNGQNTTTGNYSTLLYVEFCGGRNILIDASVHIGHDDENPAVDIAGNDIRIAEIDNCCEDFYEIQNVTYANWQTYRADANDFIRVGENITTSIAPGPVYVSPHAEVSYYAGNNIFLEPGFSAAGTFKAEIHQCGNAPKSFEMVQGGSRMKSLKRDELETADKENLNSIIKVYPNPTTGKLFLDANEEIIDVNIFSLDGKLVFNQSDVSSVRYSIDVNNLKGTYILKCQTLNNFLTKLIVVE